MIRVFLLFLISTSAIAAQSPVLKVQGKVYSFDKESVVLEQKGKKILVPRKFIGTETLKVGETVEAAFNDDEKDQVKVQSEAKK